MNEKQVHTPFEIGAKALGLYLLQQEGFRVPDFRVIPYSILQIIPEDKEKGVREIELFLHNYTPTGERFAVRSSSTIEDGTEQSFAGQFRTVLGVKKEELANAIWEVLTHFRTVTHAHYSAQQSGSFGIIIQTIIEPDFAGVGFSVHPSNADDERLHLSIVPGCGDALVSGRLESFLIVADHRHVHFEDLNKTYTGEQMGTQLPVTSLSGRAIATSVKSNLKELFSGIKQLEKIKKCPVDVEFVIYCQCVYWLQVRPITTIGEKTIRIWDNAAAEANYSGLTLPLTQSFVRRSFEKAYGSLANRLGIDTDGFLEEQLQRMCDAHQGVLYYNITAWQQLIAQLPFGIKAAGQLPHLWGMEPVPLHPMRTTTLAQRIRIVFHLMGFLFRNKNLKKKYRQELNQALYQQPGETDTIEDLKEHYLSIEKTLGNNWIAPSVNGLFALIFLNALKKAIRNSKIATAYPNFTNDILQQQTEVITVKMVRDFQHLIRSIQADKALLQLFREQHPAEILPEIAKKYPELHQLMMDYLDTFGVKAAAAELKLETVTFADNPESFIAYLAQNLQFMPPRPVEKLDYRSILSRYYPVYHPKRYWLLLLIKQSIARVSDRENYRFDRTQVFAHIRRIMQHIEMELIKNQGLHQGDIYYLQLDEILNVKPTDFHQLVAKRKKDYEDYAQMVLANRYRETASGWKSVAETITNGNLKGIGCCSGSVKGYAVVLDEHPDANADYTCKIVIAAYFEPGQIGLFSQAAGLISARGNLLSHTAILCREMGVPSIVGVKGLLSQVKTGDWIEMNGATGIINHPEHATE